MHDIEAELTKALKLKKKPDDRQKLLNAILLAMDDRERFTDDDYDALSDEAAAWHKEAVTAQGNGRNIPDFDEAEGEEADHEADEAAEYEEDENADEEPVAEEDDDGSLDEHHDAEAEANEADEELDSDGDGTAEDLPGMGADDPEESEEPVEPIEGPEIDGPEETEEQTLKKAKKIAKQPSQKSIKTYKDTPPKPKKVAPEKPKGPKTVQPGDGSFPEPDYENLSGEKDRFGHVIGTKTAEAIRMFTKGANNKQVKGRLGDTYYNLLKKLSKQGHRVEKEGHVYTLIHKDDLPKKKVK